MKKRVLDFYRRIKEKKPAWLNLQNLVFMIVILAFLIIVIWSDSLSVYFQQRATDSMDVFFTATTLPGTPTPLPEEWLSSAEQTNGVISGAIVIIIAIAAGTTAILIRDRE